MSSDIRPSYHFSVVKVLHTEVVSECKRRCLLFLTSARQTDRLSALVSDALASMHVVSDLPWRRDRVVQSAIGIIRFFGELSSELQFFKVDFSYKII
jgi:hypothetical protein